MESAGQFERLIRMVQETGERVVVSFEKGKDPVVLLPLSVYEQLVEGRRGNEGIEGISRGSVGIEGKGAHSEVPRRREEKEGGFHVGTEGLGGMRGMRGEMPRRDAPVEARMPERRLPPQSDIQREAAADAWDGEEGGEYDAERIFAQIDRDKMNNTPSQAPDRLQASVSRASEALHGGWPVGSGGQRLPIRGQALQGEERFSLGAG